MSVLVDRASLAAAKCAAKERSRFAFTNLHVGDCAATATDGKILMRVSHPKINPEDFPGEAGEGGSELPEGGTLLPTETAKTIIRSMPSKRSRQVAALPVLGTARIDATSSGKVTATTLSASAEHQTFTADAGTGAFPTCDSMIRAQSTPRTINTSTEEVAVVLNPRFLATLAGAIADAMDARGGFDEVRGVVVRVPMPGPSGEPATKPVQIETRDANRAIIGLIMPITTS